jgi:DNA (cytosine-5)-methyltransferase 1
LDLKLARLYLAFVFHDRLFVFDALPCFGRIAIMELQSQTRSEKEISAIMGRVRSRDTQPEVVLRKALWARGLRYRLCPPDLPGKPDLIFPAKRLAIFVDGDYWHGGQWNRRHLAALEEQFANTGSKDYWLKKIRGNMRRDCASTAALLSQGWKVLRFWESDIKKRLDDCVALILDLSQEATEPTVFSRLPYKTFAEFFAGIGLMRIALERQGWEAAYANDIDPKKQEMYDAHFQDMDPCFHRADVHEVDAADVPNVTLATASFPCNDLSLAGARRGFKGTQSSAFWGFMRVIERMGNRRPLLVLLENVTGFLTSSRGEDFHEALVALNRLNYSVDSFVLDAIRFVPQSRPRLFVVAVVEDDRAESDFFEPVGLQESALRPNKLVDFIVEHPDIRWKIRKLPAAPTTGRRLESVLQDLPEEAPEWWSRQRTEYLLGQMSPRHRKAAEKMIYGSKWSYATVFRRIRKGKSMAELRADGIAGCLRTPRGGSGRQILFKAGHGNYFARLLTPRECARLMGADDYNMQVPVNQALFGFGDAVCVPVIEWIAQHYLNPVVNELLRGRLLYGPHERLPHERDEICIGSV